jgi:hypothetical protein
MAHRKDVSCHSIGINAENYHGRSCNLRQGLASIRHFRQAKASKTKLCHLGEC